MENLQSKKIEIQPLGSYFDVDAEGYVINPASLDKIQEEWKPVIEDVISAYKNHFGNLLKNVYIRGSVAKGQAIKNISDIDSFCYVDLKKEDIDHEWEEGAEKEIKNRYPYVAGTELMCRPFALGPLNIILLNQSVCVYGEPINVPKAKPGKDMMLQIPNLDKRTGLLEEKLSHAETEEEVENVCVWFAKDVLRTGFELTMERSKRYTRDLYMCYKGFAEYYPDKEKIMRQVLDLALNPTGDKSKIQQVRDSISPWLIEEAKKI